MSYNNALKLFGLSSIYSIEELNFNNSNLIQRNYDKYCDRTKPEKCHLGLENIAKINLAYQILLPNAIKVGVSINRDENIYINNLCKALNLTLTKAHLNYVCDCAIGFNGTFREWLILEFQIRDYALTLQRNKEELKREYFIAKINGYSCSFLNYLEEKINNIQVLKKAI